MKCSEVLLTFKNNRLLKNTSKYFFVDVVNKSIPFILLPIIVNFLTPEDYGIITNYVVITQVISVFVIGAAQGSIPVVFFKYSKEDFKFYLSTLFSVSLTLTFVLFLIVGIIKIFEFKLLGLDSLYLYMSLVEVLMGAFTCINLLMWRCEEKPLNFGCYQIGQTLLNFSLTILMVVVLNIGWQGKVIGNFIAVTLMGAISLLILIKRGYYKIGCFKYKHFHNLILFSLPLIPHALALWGKTSIDKILITNLCGLAENGLYSTAVTWGAIISIIMASFGNAYNPYLLKKLSLLDHSKDQEFVKNEKRNIARHSYFIMIIICIVVFVSYFLFHILIIVLYPIEYHKSISYLPWIMLGELFRGCYLLFINYIHYTMNTKVLGLITFCLSLSQFVFSYILITFYGSVGAAISTCIVSFLTALFVWIYSNKVYPMPWIKTQKLWNHNS